jgi:hypothetical protein
MKAGCQDFFTTALALLLPLVMGACVSTSPPDPVAARLAVGITGCRAASASLYFDFDGASVSACTVEGPNDFSLLVTPEHAPPINPSPWYAFRYQSHDASPVKVTLRYLGGGHRYAPKWRGDDDKWHPLQSKPGDDGKSVTLQLPAGGGTVAAQEIITPLQSSADLLKWAVLAGTQPFTLGFSHDGRPIEAIRIGRHDAPRLVVVLGRQHPPEVSGAIALQAFVGALVADRSSQPEAFDDLQFLIVPMLNPDGVARGHWRANRGGLDLNRDWGAFSQPETRAVKTWLDGLPNGVRPVFMLDFHSTRSNLFYVQGETEASTSQKRFLAAWLSGQEHAFPGYPFTIEPRNANPGSGTAKNWFHATYGIPAYTYEVADDADRVAARKAAHELALALVAALETLTD